MVGLTPEEAANWATRRKRGFTEEIITKRRGKLMEKCA